LIRRLCDASQEAAADLLADLDDTATARDFAELREFDAALSRLDRKDHGVCSVVTARSGTKD
jgi:RNA polymerase-binding transcription factor DksA